MAVEILGLAYNADVGEYQFRALTDDSRRDGDGEADPRFVIEWNASSVPLEGEKPDAVQDRLTAEFVTIAEAHAAAVNRSEHAADAWASLGRDGEFLTVVVEQDGRATAVAAEPSAPADVDVVATATPPTPAKQ
jgi:hypothetical protein